VYAFQAASKLAAENFSERETEIHSFEMISQGVFLYNSIYSLAEPTSSTEMKRQNLQK
jgi:hypothetical protein